MNRSLPPAPLQSALKPGVADPVLFHEAPARAIARVRHLTGDGKDSIAASLDEAAALARNIAGRLEANSGTALAKYAHRAAGTVTDWSGTLRSTSVDDLSAEAKIVLRKSPAIAFGVFLIAAFAAVRLLKPEANSALERDTVGDRD